MGSPSTKGNKRDRPVNFRRGWIRKKVRAGFAENECQFGYGADWRSRDETATKFVEKTGGKITYLSASAAKEAAEQATAGGATVEKAIEAAILAAKRAAQVWRNKRHGMIETSLDQMTIYHLREHLKKSISPPMFNYDREERHDDETYVKVESAEYEANIKKSFSQVFSNLCTTRP